jgi:hypothetical protein
MLASCCLLRQAARNIKSGATYPSICSPPHIDGYNQLYLAGRNPGPIREAACWSHARRPFFVMADIGYQIMNIRRLSDRVSNLAVRPSGKSPLSQFDLVVIYH